MKRILLIISIAILTQTLEAQQKTTLGITGGVNFSNITSENYVESNRKIGFYLGLLTEIPLTNKFSIQSELLYATYGADVAVRVPGPGPMEVEYSLDYIQVPVLGKIYIYRNLSIEIGPAFNFLVREKGYRPGAPDIVDENGNFIRNQTDIDPDGSRFELSGLVGVSYKLNKKWVVSARFTKGLSNAFDSPSGLDGEKNDAFQFGMGFNF